MRSTPRFLAAVAIVAALVILPASAAAADPPPSIPGPIGSAYNLFDYMLSVKSQQLMGMQGPAAVGAWSAENARLGARSANAFRSGLLYGNVGAEALAEVVPLYDPIDLGYGNGRKITPKPGSPGFRVPAFSKAGFIKTVGGVGTSLLGYEIGATVGGAAVNSIGGYFGFDANGTVCSQAGDDLGGFVLQTLSGQDCSAFKATQEFLAVANADASAGLFGGEVCSLLFPGNCAGPLLGIGGSGFGRTWYCMDGTTSGSDAVLRWYEDGAVAATGSHYPHFSGPNGPAPSYFPGACSAYPGTTMAIQTEDPRALTGYVFVNPSTSVNETEVAEIEDALGDPPRTLLCVVTGSDGIDYTGETPVFYESEVEEFPAPNCPTLPAGVYATHWTITETGGPDELVLVDEDADPEYVDWADDYAETCASQSCFLDLVTIANGISCFSQNDTCDGWLSDPDRDTKYQCYYGSVAEPAASCYAYAQTFNTARRLAGDAYADPATGEPIPGGGTSLSAEQALFELSPRDVSEIRDCLGGTYGAFNPVEWIMRPVQCALEWAFVPRAEVPALLGATLEAAWVEKAPGQLAATIGGWSFSPVVTGCSIVVPYGIRPGGATENLTVLDACSEPMATVATLCRLLVSIGFTVMVFLAVKRAIGGTVDYQ